MAGRAWLGVPGCAYHGCVYHGCVYYGCVYHGCVYYRPQVGVHCASKPVGYWAFELCVNQNATQVIPDPHPHPDH